MGVGLRPRHPADLPGLLALLQRTHETEGYPVRAAAVSADWLASPDELAGWVAEAAGAVGGSGAGPGLRVCGHVALHPARGPSLPLWTAGTGRGPDGMAVVSRLFTDRTVRGAGTALLAHAVAEAAHRGLLPVLEVERASPARGLYLRRGWREVGGVVQQWGHRSVDTAALVGPGVPQA